MFGDRTVEFNGGVGIREYTRNTGFRNARFFGDFFIDPTVSAANANTPNAIKTDAAGNTVANITSPTAMISTRNFNEMIRFGDLNLTLRQMMRLPQYYGPEYLFVRDKNSTTQTYRVRIGR